MRKLCTLCRKMIEIDAYLDAIEDGEWHEIQCPHCQGILLLGNRYGKIVLEGKNHLYVKCPCCKGQILYDISGARINKVVVHKDYNFCCPFCETGLVATVFFEHDRCRKTDLFLDVNRFAMLKELYYVLAVGPSLSKVGNGYSGNILSARKSKQILKGLLAVPQSVEKLCKMRRYKDYSIVESEIKSFLVVNVEEIHKVLDKGWRIIFTSTNLLKEEKGDRKKFSYFLNLLVELVSSIKDPCGKSAIISSVHGDLNSVQAEKASVWSHEIGECESELPLNAWTFEFQQLSELPIIQELLATKGFSAKELLNIRVDESLLMCKVEANVLYQDYGYIHPYDLERILDSHGYDYEEAIAVLRKHQVKVLNTDTRGIRWKEYKEQFDNLKLKGTAMSFGAGKSIRSVIGNKSGQWRQVRAELLKKHKNTCQVCGYQTEEKKALHAHEVWDQDLEKNILILKEVQLLCNRCHDCLHMGHTMMRGADPLEMRYNRDKMVLHMAKVSGCMPEVIYSYLEYKQWAEKAESIRNRKKMSSEISGKITRYSINDLVPNKEGLEQALKEKGVLYMEEG